MAGTRDRMTQFPPHSHHHPGEKDVIENREREKLRKSDVEQKRHPKEPRPPE